jgi:hypothetical protein
MRRGLEAAESPGCFETVVPPGRGIRVNAGGVGGKEAVIDCAVVADGAHTVESAAAALATVAEVFPGRGLHSSRFQLNVSAFCGLHASTFRLDVSTFCGICRVSLVTKSSQVELISGRPAVASVTKNGSG